MDMEVTVSMKAAKMVATLEPILQRAKSAVETGDTFSETFYGKAENGDDMMVHFDNDDMERAELPDDEVLVMVEEQ